MQVMYPGSLTLPGRTSCWVCMSISPLSKKKMFGLTTVIIPRLLHEQALGHTSVGYLNAMDRCIRLVIRKWLALPHYVPVAFFHAAVRDGGLGIQSLRWSIPLIRLRRLQSVDLSGSVICALLNTERAVCTRRLNDRGSPLDSAARVQSRWADLLCESIDGRTLSDSSKVPQQHRWVSEGTRFLSGRDFLNSIKLRINALLTRSRGGTRPIHLQIMSSGLRCGGDSESYPTDLPQDQ